MQPEHSHATEFFKFWRCPYANPDNMGFFFLVATILCLLRSSSSSLSKNFDLITSSSNVTLYRDEIAKKVIADARKNGFNWEEIEKTGQGPDYVRFLFRLLELTDLREISPLQVDELARKFVIACKDYPETFLKFNYSKLDHVMLKATVRQSAVNDNLPLFEHLYRNGLDNLNEKWRLDISAVVDLLKAELLLDEKSNSVDLMEVEPAPQVNSLKTSLPKTIYVIDDNTYATTVEGSYNSTPENTKETKRNFEPEKSDARPSKTITTDLSGNNQPGINGKKRKFEMNNEIRPVKKVAIASTIQNNGVPNKPTTIDLFDNGESEMAKSRISKQKDNNFPPLPEEALKLIAAGLAAPSLTNLAEIRSIIIEPKDLRTLQDGKWLNDEVINFYFKLIEERSQGSVFTLNTFFFKKLAGSGYDEVKRWTAKVNIFAYERILIPIHLPEHWCLAELDMQEKKIFYYDSLGGMNETCLIILLSWLINEHRVRKLPTPLIFSEWQLITPNSPRQGNGTDCGVFTCVTAEYRSRNAPLTFSQANMPYFRRRIAYEILKKDILATETNQSSKSK